MSQFDNICEVQSDKASVTITSRYDGLVKALHYKVDDVAMVGSALLDIEIENDSKDVTRNDAKETVKSTENQVVDNSENRERRRTDEEESDDSDSEKTLATPAVRRIAKEKNVRLKDVKATGKDGRVLKEDILAHLQKISADPAEKTEVPSLTSVTGRTVGLKGYSKHMWKTMTKSLVSRRDIIKKY